MFGHDFVGTEITCLVCKEVAYNSNTFNSSHYPVCWQKFVESRRIKGDWAKQANEQVHASGVVN